MKLTPLQNSALSSGPHRSSALSAGSASLSRRLNGSRGSTRTMRRSWASPPQQSRESIGDGTLDETLTSLVLADEELRHNAGRLARRIRQLQARETRQRGVLADEAAQQLDNILAQHTAYSAIADACAAFQATREATQQHKARQLQQWSLQLIADAVHDLVRQESAARRAITHAEAVVRETTSQLQVVEARGFNLHESIFRLVRAEQVRRAFLLREEARGVEALQIPRFVSLPCVPSTTVLAPSFVGKHSGSDGGGRYGSSSAWRDVDKMDLMAAERCPFRCAADCPYMPHRTRQLGAAWARAIDPAAARLGRAATAAQGSQRHGISEVGKQRVRYAMAQKHLSETPHFLPSLRIGM
jgi:hypothetical protein